MPADTTLNEQHEVVIPLPTVHPFSYARFFSCVACGAHITRWDKFMAYLKTATPSALSARFCSGGKEPTENRGMIAAIMEGESQTFNPCAGIAGAHLHLKFRRCGFESLMATKSKIAAG